MEKLRPCPFCGGEAVVELATRGAKVACRDRACIGSLTSHAVFESKRDAVSAWNRRDGERDAD